MGDIRTAIREVKKENRKKYAFLIIVILIVGGTLWLRGPVSTEVITYTNPNRLSYDLPVLGQPNLILTQGKLAPARCEGDGAIQCTEPIVLSFFVQNTDSGIGRYEYTFHMRLKNNGDAASGIIPSLTVENTQCVFTGKPFNLEKGATSNRVDFLCLAREPLRISSATLEISHSGGMRATYSIVLQ